MPSSSPIQLRDSILFREHFPYGDRSARYGKQSPVEEPLYASRPKSECELEMLWRLLQLRCIHNERLLASHIIDDEDSCILTLVYEVAK
jgi:hypothetical protein